MTASDQDIQHGSLALFGYVHAIEGWRANFITWDKYQAGAKLIVDTWDSFVPEVVPADRVHACGQILYQDISEAGYSSQVTPAQCTVAAHAVLVAANRVKL